MRGKYRQTFLRISAEGEETNQSANLKVNSDKTLPIIVESVRDLGHSQSWLCTLTRFVLVDPSNADANCQLDRCSTYQHGSIC
jgi:hypothetical protein